MYLADSKQIHRADQIMIREKGYPGLLLMEAAGIKSTQFILQKFPDRPHYLVLAGPGNNGGDGLVIARYLHMAGKNVEVVLSHPPEKYQGDALVNYKILAEREIYICVWPSPLDDILIGPDFNEGTVLIDALLGTGAKGALRSPIEDIVFHYRWSEKIPHIAIDLPSGLDADSGLVREGAHGTRPIQATYTLTFQCPKICHFLSPASKYCGEVVTVDIGILPDVMDELRIQRKTLDGIAAKEFWMQPEADTHKGTQGHALLIGGSKSYAGAIALTAHSVLRSGAGLSTALTVEPARTAVYALGPEVMVKALEGDALSGVHGREVVEFVKDLGADAVGIGPGLGRQAGELMPQLLAGLRDTPMVLDADALNILAENPDLWDKIPQNTILTPHPGEFRRLAGPDFDLEDRLRSAERFARERKVILVLKGAGTVVAAPDGTTWVNTTGNPGMATAGSGDVLTGVITALLANGYPAEQAAGLGVYLHGLAGDLCAAEDGQTGVTAGGIMRKIGNAVEMLRTGTAPGLLSI